MSEERKRRYAKSSKGRLTHKRYRQSQKGKEVAKRYQKSAKGKATGARYRTSEKGKAARFRLRKTAKGISARRIQDSKRFERISSDPARLAKRRESNQKSSAVYRESLKPFSDPRRLTGHPIDAKKVVVISDVQFPWEDANALELCLQFVEKWKPDTVILNGDIADCYACSAWDRDPLKTDTTLGELYKTEQLMKRLKKVPQKIWLGGNHEDRWRRIIWRDSRSAGGMSPITQALMHGLGIDDLDINEAFRKAFRVRDNGFEYWPYGHYVELAQGNLLVTHGFAVSMHSGYSAKRHFDRLGKSVIIGHTHRQGSYLVSQLWDPRGAWENGCLCRMDPEYVQFPNWQHGFSLVTVSDKLFHVDQIPILPGCTINYGGRNFDLR